MPIERTMYRLVLDELTEVEARFGYLTRPMATIAPNPAPNPDVITVPTVIMRRDEWEQMGRPGVIEMEVSLPVQPTGQG